MEQLKSLSEPKPSHSISIEELKAKLQKHPESISLEPILNAYEFSKKAHEGQKRKSGEPYISHPLSVAGILADLGMDQESIIAGLLHDVVEDTPVSLKDIEKEFGKTQAFLLDGLTKISRLNFKKTQNLQSENIRKMFVAMGRDVRVILIKLADRLHNLRTLHYLPEKKRVLIANETLEVYTPLASRLGMNEIKVEMEDLSFKHAQPENFARLERKMSEINKDKNIYIEKTVRLLKKKLTSGGVWNAEVTGRYKNLYSIHRKMTHQYSSFEEIYDIVAFRICVEEIHECYEALGLAHEMWKPVPRRFKDFIAMPKSNGYQSLHTAVFGPEGRQIEIQIRTFDMHLKAERGVAAHWVYKMGGKKVKGPWLVKFNWLKDLLTLHQNAEDSGEFLENVKRDLFESEIFARTPEGEIKEFPKGASPIDFAYSIHTQIGERISGAKVNGRQVALDYKLESGDTVEIITSKKQKPSKDWLKICKTSRARSKIKSFFKAEERKKALEVGKKIFEKACSRFQINEKEIFSDPRFSEFLKSRGMDKKESLFIELGFGKLDFKQVLEYLKKTGEEEKGEGKNPLSLVTEEEGKEKSSSGSPLVIEGINDVMVNFAKCCYPVAGDPIKAYVSKKRGIMVHRGRCKDISSISSDRFIEVNWRADQSQSNDYTVALHTVCIDKPGALSRISEAFNFFDLNITHLKVTQSDPIKAFLIFHTKVKGLRQINQLIARLNQIENIISVKRKMGLD